MGGWVKPGAALRSSVVRRPSEGLCGWPGSQVHGKETDKEMARKLITFGLTRLVCWLLAFLHNIPHAML